MDREEILELRLVVQKFVRLFGMQEQSITPCGFPLSPSQVFALQELENKTATVGELADKLLLERSTVSRLVDSLVKGGFVSRIVNEVNRREVLVSLTIKGKTSLQQVREQSIQFYSSILENIEEREQIQILRSFQSLTESIAKVRGEQYEQ